MALFLGACETAACAGYSQERQALIDFFQAARLRDTTVLSNIATVTFEPRTDGIVQQFEIERVEAQPPRIENGHAVETKHASVDAQVRIPDGEVVAEKLEVTFERPVGGRWMITQLRASRISRAASSGPPN